MSLDILLAALPYVGVGFAAGALVASVAGACVAAVTATKATERTNARRAAERRETIALRKIIAACDREAALSVVRRIASEALYPRAIALHDQAPIIPEAQRHG